MISLNTQQCTARDAHSRADESELDHFFSIPLTADTDSIYGGAGLTCTDSHEHNHPDGAGGDIGESPIKLEDSGWSEESAWVGFQLNRSVSNFTSQSSVDSSAGCPIGVDLLLEPSGDRMEVDPQPGARVGPSGSSAAWKMNHSEVEKLRRDKMNNYINEMSDMVPLCRSASRKLDKLTVLRMTAQHLKTLRIRRMAGTQADSTQLFTAPELQRLIQQNFDGFILVIGCDRARVLYASKGDSSRFQEFEPRDLIGQNLFDIIHIKDVNLVKEQMQLPESLSGMSQESVPELAGAFHGLRRNFYCRFRTDVGPNCRRRGVVRQYEHLHCVGFIHWLTGKQASVASTGGGGEIHIPGADFKAAAAAAAAVPTVVAAAAAMPEPEPKPVAQLVLLCRPASPADLLGPPNRVRRPPDVVAQFHARLSLEGRLAWTDQRVAPLLGHLPQDLQDTSLYDLVSREDLHRLSVAHASALKTGLSRVTLQHCGLRSGWVSGESVQCSLSLQCFANPLTQSPEFLSLTVTLMPDNDAGQASPASAAAGTAGERQRQFQCQNSDGTERTSPQSPPQPPQPLQPQPQKVANNGGGAGGWRAVEQLLVSMAQASDDRANSECAADTGRMALLGAEGGLGDGLADCDLPWPL